MAFRRTREKRAIKLVSLIDVVFLLLIFFLITTSIVPTGEKYEKKVLVASPNIKIGRTEVLIQLYWKDEIESCWSDIQAEKNPDNLRYLWLHHSDRVSDGFQDIMDAKKLGYTIKSYRAMVVKTFQENFLSFNEAGLERKVQDFSRRIEENKKVYFSIRVPEDMEYFEAIKVASMLSMNGISNYGFVGGSVGELMRGSFDIKEDKLLNDEFYTITPKS